MGDMPTSKLTYLIWLCKQQAYALHYMLADRSWPYPDFSERYTDAGQLNSQDMPSAMLQK